MTFTRPAGGGRWPRSTSSTCHDGFTLADLVSYDRKHNEANGEDNLDGTDDNRSWNCGAEGPSDDPAVTDLRARQVRNFLVTLFCSQGVPMLLAGDEMGRTQRGNNNAYCQDNELSWVDWQNAGKYTGLRDFTCALSALRRAHPMFRRRRFFSGLPPPGCNGGLRDIIWLTPSGREMTDADWQAGHAEDAGSLPERRRHHRARHARRARARHALPAAVQRAQRHRTVCPAPYESRRRLACCCRYDGASAEPGRHQYRRLARDAALRRDGRRGRPLDLGTVRR